MITNDDPLWRESLKSYSLVTKGDPHAIMAGKFARYILASFRIRDRADGC